MAKVQDLWFNLDDCSLSWEFKMSTPEIIPALPTPPGLPPGKMPQLRVMPAPIADYKVSEFKSHPFGPLAQLVMKFRYS